MSKGQRNTLLGVLVFFLVVWGFTSFVSYVFIPESKPTPIVIKTVETAVEVPMESGKDVYVTDNMNDENLATITDSSPVSYWYVDYSVHVAKSDSRYEGWQVIQLTHPYYDTYEAVHAILPTYIKEDYVGVHFFKRVPFEVYKSFLKDSK